MSVLTVPLAPYHINKVSGEQTIQMVGFLPFSFFIIELANDPRPVSSFSDTFFILANQSTDPNIQKLASEGQIKTNSNFVMIISRYLYCSL